jgi:uncharacterized membrane protein HdeD (DUF308 family)
MVWRVLAGLALVVLGFVMAATPVLSSIAVGFTWGALLLASAFVQLLAAVILRPPKWGWFALASLVPGIVGVMFLADPVAGVVGLTVLIAAFLIAAGVSRLALAASWRPRKGTGWLVFHGVLSVLLGVFVIAWLPMSGLLLPGTLLAIETIAAGFSVMLGRGRFEAPEERVTGPEVRV